MSALRLATRGSDLALAQAREVAGLIEGALGRRAELVVVKTTGDRIQDVSLAKVGGKGLFVKEIEEALLEGRVDVAVHSAKDLPARIPDGLVLAAFPERRDARDALVCRERGGATERLATGARVGTGSLRRAAQLRALRPDLEIVPLRGNVPTRLRKLEELGLDAVVLACAGLERLGLAERIDERMAPELLLPAVGQGTLALETRAGDPLARDLLALGDPVTAVCTAAERGFLVRVGGDCNVPLAAYAQWRPGETLRLRGLVASEDGARMARAEVEADAADAEAAGARAADEVLARGGAAILAALRAEAGG